MSGKKNKLPSGSYRVQRVIGNDDEGNPIRKSFTAANKREANRIADQYVAIYQKAKVDLTIEDAIKKYIKLRTATLSPTTITGYNSAFKYLTEKCKDDMKKSILKADSDDFQHIIDKMLDDGLSNKTVRNRLGLIVTALDHYKVNIDGYQLPAKKRPDLYVPTDDEMHILLEACKDTIVEIPILLAAFGPMRAGEALGLQEKAIKGNVIHVYRTMYYTGSGYAYKDIPKTYGSDRYIEYPHHVISRIREKGLPDINLKLLDYYFKRLLKENNLPDFRFHDLRHWCASTLHAQGVPDAYIMQRGGWSSDNTLQSVYRHILADQNVVMTKKALDHFDSIL